jgi:FkbM family methyltransferase
LGNAVLKPVEWWRFLGAILRHPTNRGRTARAICRVVGWQLGKRFGRWPRELPLPGGMRLLCPRDSAIASLVAYTGLPDYEMMSFLLHYLRPGDSFVDVGANIGLYTLLAAGCTCNGRLYCFEPGEAAYSWLVENLGINGLPNRDAHRAAVGSHAGETRLARAERSEMNHIAATGDVWTASDEVIRVVSLDEVFGAAPDESLVLGKVDVEGYEVPVFRGAQTLLKDRRPQAWIVEIGDWGARYGYARAELSSILRSAGYAFFDYDPVSRGLRPSDSEAPLPGTLSRNVLAIGDLSFVRQRLAESLQPSVSDLAAH